MMRLDRLRVAGPLLAVLGALACDGPNTTLPVPGSASRSTAPAATLGAEITALITSGFPKGQATAIAARWDQVLRSVAKEPKVTLKGKLVPGSGGRAELVKAVKYIESKTSVSTPPTGETQAHFVARLVLDMSLYVYAGEGTPVPTIAPGSDVVLQVVQPTTTDTVVTPAVQAAVIFPAGAVSEPTVVVITADATYYPANCSGPLDTKLCQYPRFYKFNVFPDVKLNVPAHVQVCHVDAGTLRRPLADHMRFKMAHEKPADPANYSSGNIVDNVELLTPVAMSVTTCTAGDSTQYLPPPPPPPTFGSMTSLGRLTHLASLAAHRLSVAARGLVTPREAYAIDVGMGGESSFFSTFGVVDPESKADLAQSTVPATAFHSTSDSLAVGVPAPIAPWNISNVGNGTSGAFTSDVIVAYDAALTYVVSTAPVGGAASLVPLATFTYGAMNVSMPSTPGTYYVGTRITPAGFDSSATNNWTSVQVVVKAPIITGPQTVGAQSWAGTGPDTIAVVVNSADSVTLGYRYHYPMTTLQVNVDGHSVFPWKVWTYSTTAVASGSYTFHYNYSGNHYVYNAYATLEAFAVGPSGTVVVVPLIPYASYTDPYGNVNGPFTFSGNATLILTAGQAWGVRPAGYNYDSNYKLIGTVTLTPAVYNY